MIVSFGLQVVILDGRKCHKKRTISVMLLDFRSIRNRVSAKLRVRFFPMIFYRPLFAKGNWMNLLGLVDRCENLVVGLSQKLIR